MSTNRLERILLAELIVEVSSANRTADVADLARSLADQGQNEPIYVRRTPAGLVLMSGHRRVAAARMLGWEMLDAIVA